MSGLNFSIPVDGNKIAILDACQYGPKADRLLITRINVPAAARGQGIGRELLNKICKAADRGKMELFIEVSAYADSPMQNASLHDWYKRNGFVDFGGILRRIPK